MRSFVTKFGEMSFMVNLRLTYVTNVRNVAHLVQVEICADVLRKLSSRSVTYTKLSYALNMKVKSVL